MKSKRTTNRSFPGRLTLEEWLGLPFLGRLDLMRRAQCELLDCHRLCERKQCRRHRTCCGDDSMACERRLWQLPKTRPKTLRRESARLDDLARLRGPDGVAPWENKASLKPHPGLARSVRVPGKANLGSSRASGPALDHWEIIQTGQTGEGDKTP
jgi:hypothetical protein